MFLVEKRYYIVCKRETNFGAMSFRQDADERLEDSEPSMSEQVV